MRPVLFVFYTLETVFNMFCMGYHITGFQAIQMNMFGWEEQALHYFYLLTFYGFMVLTLFQSVNLCTGRTPTITSELFKSTAASIAFVGISLTTMWDAERQYHMFDLEEEEPAPGKFIEHKPVHPFFLYMRGQSISSLACGVLYLLHACLMLDFKLTNKRGSDGYMPIPMFVFGRWVHTKLEKYQWFREFSLNEISL